MTIYLVILFIKYVLIWTLTVRSLVIMSAMNTKKMHSYSPDEQSDIKYTVKIYVFLRKIRRKILQYSYCNR